MSVERRFEKLYSLVKKFKDVEPSYNMYIFNEYFDLLYKKNAMQFMYLKKLFPDCIDIVAGRTITFISPSEYFESMRKNKP